MVFCKRKVNCAVGGSPWMIITRNMKNVNQEAFLANVACICWETVVSNFGYTNHVIRERSALFSVIIEKHASMREMRISDKNSPWITSELKSMMISRDRLKKASLYFLLTIYD